MKKLIVFLILVLFPVTCFAGTLADSQKYMYNHAPRYWSYTTTLTGTVAEIYRTNNASQDYEIIVTSDDDKALTPRGHDSPYFIAHFAFIFDHFPLEVGDRVEIYGEPNCFYSTVYVPFVSVQRINGMTLLDWEESAEGKR